MNSPDDLAGLLGAHAVQLAEWSQDPNNADAAVTLLVMAQHCNEAAAEIERLRKDLDDSDAAASVLADQAAAQCIRAEKSEAEVERLREAAVIALQHFGGEAITRRRVIDALQDAVTPNTGIKGRERPED